MANMLPQEIINALVEQVKNHRFSHLYRNNPTGHFGQGWGEGLLLYSANKPKPDSAGHFQWLNNIRQRVRKAKSDSERIKIANDILQWGGMKTRIKDNETGQVILNAVIQSALEGRRVADAPMNSSYTKIAAVFGYDNNNLNTIWDSRVSTALCFRLACILKSMNVPPQSAREMFPGLGYIPGASIRARRRRDLLRQYWRNVYQQWEGHFIGAHLIFEIAKVLNDQEIPCPEIENDPDPKIWTPWKVNMVFFIDDITQCPDNGECSNTTGGSPCGHTPVNRIAGIHFEPDCIKGELNDAEKLGLPKAGHGLEKRRILLEFFRIKKSGNCKISARVRINDPAFDSLLEAADEAGCPPKRGGVVINNQTSSIFAYPLGDIPKGEEDQEIKKFTCNPHESYRRFLEVLPRIMETKHL